MAFSAAYAVGYLLFGKFIDFIGTRIGYSLSAFLWSLAAMSHAWVGSTIGFIFARMSLGISEGGNFPAAVKATAEWFPIKERALATSIFNAGTNVGAVAAPILIPWILGRYGWKEAFIWTGALGFIWLIAWLIYFEIPARHKKLSKNEFEFIQQDAEPQLKETVSWHEVLRLRQTWSFIIAKFLADPVWWFYLFWLPSYFSSAYAIDLRKPNWQLAIVYSVATIGTISGGFFSSYLIKKGWPVYKARQIPMLIYGLMALPIALAPFSPNIGVAVAIMSLAMAAHQALSSIVFTSVTDMFPRKAISTVVGLGGMAGSIGGILFPILVGRLLEYFKQQGSITTGYSILFVICASVYIIVWKVMKLLSPKLERVTL